MFGVLIQMIHRLIFAVYMFEFHWLNQRNKNYYYYILWNRECKVDFCSSVSLVAMLVCLSLCLSPGK